MTDRVGELVEALKLFTSASMGSSGIARGESSIGWQRGDGLTASERVAIARAALARVEGDDSRPAQARSPGEQGDGGVVGDDAWIEWSGGATNEAPVNGAIEWRNKHGDSEVFHDATKVDGWIKGHRYQIVAYRVVSAPTAPLDDLSGGDEGSSANETLIPPPEGGDTVTVPREPVAWRYRPVGEVRWTFVGFEAGQIIAASNRPPVFEIEPLYAAAPTNTTAGKGPEQ